MNLFSIKMRASKKNGEESTHVSGAEKLTEKENTDFYAKSLIKRALCHENGVPDFINLKIEEIDNSNILKLNALPVTRIDVETTKEGYLALENLLLENGIKNSEVIFEYFKKTSHMRGAMIFDINSFKNLEKDNKRGVRATCMDSDKLCLDKGKNHFREALILATKVANAPHIVGEICVSDDADYQIGYFASKKSGYVRITKLKEKGDTFGGRIFLYNGKTDFELKETIDFIENKPVIVLGIEDCKNPDKYSFIREGLENLSKNNLLREECEIKEINGQNIKADKNYIMFSSNNYLGFANNKEIKEYSKIILDKFGTGTAASRLVSGTCEIHKELEKSIIKFKGTEDAIVFNTGYCANAGTLSSLFNDGDVIFSDELNHASIIDGCKLSKAKTIVYKHNDMNDLVNKIKHVSFKNGVIVTDAVFSMDGDIANLPKIIEISKKYNLFSYVDEAHSTGVLGANGHGIVEHFNLSEKPDILMGTLSKAIGSEGGYIAGKKVLIDYLRNTARSYIFSTAISYAAVSASLKAFDILSRDNSSVQKLHENIKTFNEELKKININVNSETPIFFITIGDEGKALSASKYLFEHGYFIKAIRYPTVKKNRAGLRITLSALHTKEDIINLCKALKEVICE